MNNLDPKRMIDQQRALLETSQSIAAKTFEAAAGLLQLNMQAASGILGETSKSAEAGAAPAPTPGSAALSSGMTDYLQRASELLMTTNVEIGRLVMQQMEASQALMNEMLGAAVSGAPGLPEAMRQATSQSMEAMRGLTEQAGRMTGAGAAARPPATKTSRRKNARR